MPLPEWALSLWARVEPYASRLAIWRGYESQLQTLLILAVGIALYTLLVFAFYQNISKRNAFEFARRPGWGGRLLAVLQTGLVFPLMSFLYFAVLALSLFVLAKSETTSLIFALAMSVVVSVRVTAFLSESASVDLAKMLPLALLGVLLVDPSYATLAGSWAHVKDVPSLVPVLWRDFVLFIALEGTLRLGRYAVARVARRAPKAQPPPAQPARSARTVDLRQANEEFVSLERASP
jgi:hypothetical protein